MKYIQTDFTNELTELLKKHNKCFDADKHGIYVIDSNNISLVMVGEAETASENPRPLMIQAFDYNLK